MSAPAHRARHPLATQAALACQTVAFRTFLREAKAIPVVTEDDAAAAVRGLCGWRHGRPDAEPLSSRAALDDVPSAGARWRDLWAQYQAWRQAR